METPLAENRPTTECVVHDTTITMSVFAKYASKLSYYSLLSIPLMFLIYFLENNYDIRIAYLNYVFIAPFIAIALCVFFCVLAGFIQITYQSRFGLNEILRALIIYFICIALMCGVYLLGYCPSIFPNIPLHGKHTFMFHPNGAKSTEVYSWFGKTYRYVTYYDNNQIESDEYFEETKNDIVSKSLMVWYRNGKILIKGEGSFHTGPISLNITKKQGKWQYFDETGRLVKEELYSDDGKLITTR
jgi:hypothetical protein